MRKLICFFLSVLFIPALIIAEGDFKWDQLPPLPLPTGDDNKPILAGFFAGVHNDALIIAGGQRFPDSTSIPSWAVKTVYERKIFVLPFGKAWTRSDVGLPVGYSFGASVQTDEGLICIGGEYLKFDGDNEIKTSSDEVIIIKYTGDGKIELDRNSFPKLPLPLSSPAAAIIGNYIYVSGGYDGKKDTKTFIRIDLTKKDEWEKVESWPGLPRSKHSLVTQSDGENICLFLFGGTRRNLNNASNYLRDVYKFVPEEGSWTKLSRIGSNISAKSSYNVAGAAAVRVGANHIALFGSQVLVYHTITDTWVTPQNYPGYIEGLNTTAVNSTRGVIIPGGSVKKGESSLKMWIAAPDIKNTFGLVNFLVLGVYLSALIIMGVYFSRREKSTDDFFKAGGRVPWWAAGLSIFGTQLSAITFMAIPAKSFATDWTWFMMNMTIVAVAPLIVFYFLPFYRRLNVTTAYEYIEKRFNVVVRLMASAMFILFQFARIGIVLFLPSIALSVVTGIDIRLCITVMALLSIAYTVLGGIEAVIWTDVLQVFVLLGGALLVLFLIPAAIPGGVGGMMDLAVDAEKLRLFNFHFSLESPTLWVLVLGGIGANLVSYGSDQTVIQRYLTTKDEKSAAKGIWTNALLTIPASIIFFALGTALYTFFKANPESLTPALQKTDAIFPWFIMTQLPAGISGLLIAGIFAAAMSSLDSSMNSVSAAFTTDFYRRFKPESDESNYLLTARIVTVIIGLLGMVFALIMTTWDIQSLWGEFMKFIGLFGGGLGGLFILAIFTKRTSARGAIAGLLISAAVQYLLSTNSDVHGVLFAATGMITCIVTGYLASMLLPQKDKDLDGLTMYTLEK